MGGVVVSLSSVQHALIKAPEQETVIAYSRVHTDPFNRASCNEESAPCTPSSQCGQLVACANACKTSPECECMCAKSIMLSVYHSPLAGQD